jgi:hypothetical protein
MRIAGSRFFVFASSALFAAALTLGGASSNAQNSDFKLELHAGSHGSAADVGLPAYPGATLDKDTDNSCAADLGFTFGDTRFRLIVAKYVTKDSSESVLNFYRRPLSHFGDVLECSQGKPAGKQTATKSGLTCSNDKESHVTESDHSTIPGQREIRAGSPNLYRMVCFEDSDHGLTRFVLVYIETPKDSEKAER